MKSFFINPFLVLLKFRKILWKTTWNELKSRYAGSVLGLFWIALFPFLFLSCYAVIYLFVFKIRFAEFGSVEYVMLIFCGLIPFLGFADSLATGVSSVVNNASLVKNTMFPIEIVPVKAVLASQLSQVIGLVLLLIVLFFKSKITVWVLLLPVIWLLQLMYTLGLIWILSALNIFIRDLQQIISVLILMLMMVSPIAYTVDMVPPGLRLMLFFNPLYYIIIAYQQVLMIGEFPPTHIVLGLITQSVVLFLVGFWVFERMKKVFADNI